MMNVYFEKGPIFQGKKKNHNKKDKKDKSKARPLTDQYAETRTKNAEPSQESEKIENRKAIPPLTSEKTSSIPKHSKSFIPVIPDRKRLLIDNNAIQLLINSIDQKFSTCCIDTDFPIVIDTMINAAADLTLAKCDEAHKSLLKVSQVTDNVESMSNKLEVQANEICSQADLTLSQMKSIEDKINDVLYPKTSLFVKIVSTLLFIITSLFHLFQRGIGKIDDESLSDDEKSSD